MTPNKLSNALINWASLQKVIDESKEVITDGVYEELTNLREEAITLMFDKKEHPEMCKHIAAFVIIKAAEFIKEGDDE